MKRTFCRLLPLVFVTALFAAPGTCFGNEARVFWLLVLPNSAAPSSISTTDVKEKEKLVHTGWRVSATGHLLLEGGDTLGALHRMIKVEKGKVLRASAADPDQVSYLKAAGYRTEGVLGFASLAKVDGGVAIHRYTGGGAVVWAAADSDRAWLKGLGWKDEGPAFWLLP